MAADGRISVKIDGVGPASVSSEASTSSPWSAYASTALEAAAAVLSNPGTLRSVLARLDATAPTGTYYVQLINSDAVPPDGAVTMIIAPVKLQHVNGTDQNASIDLTLNGLEVTNGAVVCLSSTEFVKTVSGAYLSITALRA